MSTRHPRSQSSWQLRPRGLNKAVLKLGDYFYNSVNILSDF